METAEMTQAKADTLQKLALLNELTEQSIMAMGLSFVLGSFFTILLLMMLDYIRSRSNKSEEDQ